MILHSFSFHRSVVLEKRNYKNMRHITLNIANQRILNVIEHSTLNLESEAPNMDKTISTVVDEK